jgi:hypothetical protein
MHGRSRNTGIFQYFDTLGNPLKNRRFNVSQGRPSRVALGARESEGEKRLVEEEGKLRPGVDPEPAKRRFSTAALRARPVLNLPTGRRPSCADTSHSRDRSYRPEEPHFGPHLGFSGLGWKPCARTALIIVADPSLTCCCTVRDSGPSWSSCFQLATGPQGLCG